MRRTALFSRVMEELLLLKSGSTEAAWASERVAKDVVHNEQDFHAILTSLWLDMFKQC